ncbi:HotDog domain-containing protein [Phlyctochytrium arcticum]|nr:HotDog domain-containing protein [Phlyctochytrium arcticum]
MWINRFLAEKQQQAVELRSEHAAARGDHVVLEKRMQESYIEEYLPFKSSPDVLEEYINVHGGIRIGKIFEDLDALAGSIAYMHCDDSKADTVPLTIVTASVDRIDMLDEIPADQDVRISGHVTWVGKSSMEVSCWVEAVPEGIVTSGKAAVVIGGPSQEKIPAGNPILAAKFSMVARDPYTGKAAPINQLRLETEQERRLFRRGEEHKARKVAERKFDLDSVPPSFEEMKLVHDLYKENRQYFDAAYNKDMPSDTVWMGDAVRQNLVMCMPQDRNIHGNVFGGYLIRLAYELAYSTGLIFCKSRVNFVALDDIVFKKPVHVGSLLSLTSQVVYSAGSPSKSIQVKVRADVVDPIKDENSTTNTFHFTFTTDGTLPRIMPRSYDESMRYIEGRRKKQHWMEHAAANAPMSHIK